VDEVGAPEVWVTHGRDDALIHAMAKRGVRGRALHLIGLGDYAEDAAPGGADDAGGGAAAGETAGAEGARA
jgi:putative mRNA 3-end processing factor